MLALPLLRDFATFPKECPSLRDSNEPLQECLPSLTCSLCVRCAKRPAQPTNARPDLDFGQAAALARPGREPENGPQTEALFQPRPPTLLALEDAIGSEFHNDSTEAELELARN